MSDANCAWNNGNNNNGNNNNVVGAAALPIVNCQLKTGMFSGQENSIADFQGNAQNQAKVQTKTKR